MTRIQTYTGQRVSANNPQADSIKLEDIAHGLAMTCRFAGQCRNFYSVAQHSVLVACLLDPPRQKKGLFHDAPEAYTGDPPTPFSLGWPGYQKTLAALWETIAPKYGMTTDLCSRVNLADKMALAIEANSLFDQILPGWEMMSPLQGWSIRDCWVPQVAKMNWLYCYELISEGKSLQPLADMFLDRCDLVVDG